MSIRLPHVIRSAGIKPRVLLVDDHPGVLDRVSAILGSDYDLVGSVTDGRQAIEAARQLDPDVIVLDITMPEFDGFETIRALERAGSRAAVIFLSMLGDDAPVTEAFRLGGRGYVLKSHMLSDLPAALDQVLHGRRFVPSLTSCLEVTGGSGHAMHAPPTFQPRACKRMATA